MKTFVELKEIEKVFKPTVSFQEVIDSAEDSGLYVVFKEGIGTSDVVFVNKTDNILVFVCPLGTWQGSKVKTYSEPKENQNETKTEPNENLKESFGFITESGFVSEAFVKEFAQILLKR